MRIIDPVDQKPIKYWDDGEIKYIHDTIWVLDGREEVLVAVFTKPWFAMTEAEAKQPVDDLIKKAVYKIEGQPDELGLAKYKLTNRKELETKL